MAQGALEARALQARVADALAARGFPRERPWHPHVTIGRVHDERRWRREAGPPLRSALTRAATITFGRLRVLEVALMRSELSPAGARYAIRCGVPLVAGARPDRDPGAGPRAAL
jgi:2'-5' RNA ligase